MLSKASSTSQGRLTALWIAAVCVLVFFFLYVWRQIEPVLQHHGGPAFFLDETFAKPFLRRPGGPVEYVAAFCAQLAHDSLLGAAALTGLAAVAVWATRRVLVRAGATSLQTLAFTPAFLLLLLANYYKYPVWQTAWEFTLGLLGVVAFLRWAPDKSVLRVALTWLFIGLLFYVGGGLAGGGFVLVTAAFDLAVRRSRVWVVLLLLASVLVPWAVCALSDQNFTGLWRHWGKGLTLAFSIALLCFLPLVILLSGFLRKRTVAEPGKAKTKAGGRTKDKEKQPPGRLSRLTGLAQVAFPVLAAVAVLALADQEQKALLAVEYYAEEGDWSQVLAAAPRVQSTSSSARLHILQALYHTARLADDLFRYRHVKGMDLFPDLGQGLQVCRALSQTMLELGQVNLAEHYAHEALEVEGERPVMLLLLARINVLKDRPAAARIFLNRLRQVPFHRAQADRWLRALEADPKLAADKEIMGIRALMVTTDLAGVKVPTERLLQQLLQSNSGNRMAFEYLMAHYLLTQEQDKLIKHLGRLDVSEQRALPRHSEEAILIQQQLNRNERVALLDRVRPETRQRFERLNEHLRLYGVKSPGRERELAKDYGDTYWYYFLYGQTYGPGGPAPEK